MLGHLRRSGYTLVPDADQADVIVVNTCGFIDQARQESVNAILEMAREKETGRARRLVVTGCLVQGHDAELRQAIPEIDATLGVGQVEGIVAAVGGEATVLAPGAPTWIPDHTTPRVLSTPPHLAYLKISEGCDCACSFCVIPALRGRQRSRPVEDVVAEARALAERGVREAVLVAQDSTRYGLDLGLRDGLALLLRRLGGVDGLRWIRVMYAHPGTTTDRILGAIAEEEKVVKYVDMPLQHANRNVLRRMGRPASRGGPLALVERVRRRVPGVAFRTSLLVGFPGETEAEFEDLVAFVAEGEVDHLGVFTYSHEEGTAAHALADDVPARVKARRERRLLSLQRRLSLRRNRRRVGQRVEVLVEGVHPECDWLLRGRLPTQAPEIDGSVILNDGRARAGEIVAAEVTAAHPYDLVARIV